VIISLLTACIIGFRWWDSRTRLGITFWVDRTDPESTSLFFRVVNNSKAPLYLSRGVLEYGNDEYIELRVAGGGGAFGVGTYRGTRRYQLPPNLPMAFVYPIETLAKCLLDKGCKDPIQLTFVTLDGTEKRYEKTILLMGLKEWSEEENGPDPEVLLPWYQRWFRRNR